ncbi:RNA polymerase sigma factor [Massilibacteroides vaginae]|uniref:RNA polymerase sigma factor n=1 Tax=Massilibacteroides vaginae TaxID=1673718 RepID=UPI000A1CA84E|nr:sigma-70 family RNA polymerase sigma factor [Massilibacteroides vaginae]
MELYTDIYYIKRIQSGDTASFACLLDRYSRPVYSLIARIVSNREDAEELAQDVFLKAFKNLSGFKGDSSFSTWLYRIAYNTAISATRKKKQEFLAIEDGQLDNTTGEDLEIVYGSAQNEEQIKQLEAALELLSPEERALILLFYMEDKTIDEIREISGLTAVNVKTKLHRIRKKLYIILTEMKKNE